MYDLVVIGGGSGGLRVATAAARVGARVALVEKKRLGGEGTLAGCVPSKGLVQAAKLVRQVRSAGSFGLRTGTVDVDFPAVMKYVRSVVEGFAVDESDEVLRARGIEIYHGSAAFEAYDTVRIDGTTTVLGQRFVIATGSRPAIPEVPGLSEAGYLDDIRIGSLERLPESLTVIGSGPSAIEFAQSFARFGSQVTILASSPRILPQEDLEASECLAGVLKAEGMTIHLNVEIAKVEVRSGKKACVFRDTVTGSTGEVASMEILVESGRVAQVEGLNLEAVGVHADAQHGIEVDDYFQTHSSRIYAVGDVLMREQWAHAAEQEAAIVFQNAVLRKYKKLHHESIPRATFSDPEVASVGISEAQAVAESRDHRVYRVPFTEVDRARIDRRTAGFAKVLATPGGKILGVTVVGDEAALILQPFVLAMEKGLGLADIAAAVPIYPTYAGAARSLADQFLATRLEKGFFQTALRFFYGFLRARRPETARPRAIRPGRMPMRNRPRQRMGTETDDAGHSVSRLASHHVQGGFDSMSRNMRRRASLALAGIVLWTRFVQGADEARKPQIPDLKIEKYTLPNGLTVLLHEDHTTPVAAVDVYYQVGSKDEKPGRTGFAHLFEHMMFLGSKHHNQDFSRPLERLGAESNATTDEDRTEYYERVPRNALERALWLEADRMGFLLPAMTQEKLDRERDVVKNERRETVDNAPYGQADEAIREALYPEDHPYRHSVIGSMADLSAASLADVSAFFQAYYAPDNAILCVAGDFAPEQVRAWIARYFGPLPRGPRLIPPKPAVPSFSAPKQIRLTDAVSLPRVQLVWPTVPAGHPDEPALDMLAAVLGGLDKENRLFRELMYDRQLAAGVAAAHPTRLLAGTFEVELSAHSDGRLDDLVKIADAQIERLRREGPTALEVRKVQNQRESELIMGLQSVARKAAVLNQYQAVFGDPLAYRTELDKVFAVTPEDVRRVALKYLGPNRVELDISPGEAANRPPVAAAVHPQTATSPAPPLAEIPDNFDRSIMPDLGPTPRYRAPRFERRRLSNGLELRIIERHELPIVTVELVVKSGESLAPKGKEGLASLAASLLEEGTKAAHRASTGRRLIGDRCHPLVLGRTGIDRHQSDDFDATSGPCPRPLRGRGEGSFIL